jgi:hypothetical protein
MTTRSSAGAVNAELGRELHLGVVAGEGPADEDLVVARPVDVGCVDVRDAKLQHSVYRRGRLVPGGRAVVLTHAHTAEASGRNGEIVEGDTAHVVSFR